MRFGGIEMLQDAGDVKIDFVVRPLASPSALLVVMNAPLHLCLGIHQLHCGP